MAPLPSWLSSPSESKFFGRFQVAVSRDVTPCPLVRYLTAFQANLLPPIFMIFYSEYGRSMFFRTVNKSVPHYTASRLKTHYFLLPCCSCFLSSLFPTSFLPLYPSTLLYEVTQSSPHVDTTSVCPSVSDSLPPTKQFIGLIQNSVRELFTRIYHV